ncbi:MAG: TonB-dependent receptor, partial [Pedobacter sp.]
MKRIFTKLTLLVAFCILTVSAAIAQNVTVSGKVTDGKLPIPGAGVTVKGTTTATVTNADGNYTISVPSNGTLVFTYLGFNPREVVVGTQTSINISMTASTQDLEQVVVTGYGTQRRRDLTGAIASVSGEEIARQPNISPLASLQGKVAGLTVVNSGGAGSQPVIRIRGISSTNSASPLFVVDGLLQDNIDYLNAADIESVDLLRDASSSAIYGNRGANGVIAITTKRAAIGQTRINFTTNVGTQNITDLIDVVDAAGFRTLYDRQLANINAAPFDYSGYTGNTNWQEQIIQNGAIANNNLSFSTNNGKSNTLINLGHNYQDGVLKYNTFERFVLRINQEINLNENIKVIAYYIFLYI